MSLYDELSGQHRRLAEEMCRAQGWGQIGMPTNNREALDKAAFQIMLELSGQRRSAPIPQARPERPVAPIEQTPAFRKMASTYGNARHSPGRHVDGAMNAVEAKWLTDGLPAYRASLRQ